MIATAAVTLAIGVTLAALTGYLVPAGDRGEPPGAIGAAQEGDRLRVAFPSPLVAPFRALAMRQEGNLRSWAQPQ